MYLAIIGTAGRKDDGRKLSRAIYLKMYRYARNLILQGTFGNQQELELVSGGAAWADHIAVSLHKDPELKLPLTLFFPADWDFTKQCYCGNQAASTANYYHEKFSRDVGVNTLTGLEQALLDKNVTYFVNLKGFLERNIQVATLADVVLAFTFGKGEVPKDGGTRHTWDRCEGKLRIHVPINQFIDDQNN
jgi:hypothetical protein